MAHVLANRCPTPLIDSLTDLLATVMICSPIALRMSSGNRCFSSTPRADCAVGHHRPQGTRGQARGIREAAHLIGRDFTETAAAAETEREGIVR